MTVSETVIAGGGMAWIARHDPVRPDGSLRGTAATGFPRGYTRTRKT